MSKMFDFKLMVFLSAMFITACAALFSVSGIGKLYAGSMISAILMASALELGKVVSISFLYRYWTEIGKALKAYLLISSVVLMGITSAGIYGYLTAAYAEVATGPLTLTSEINTLENRVVTIGQDVDRKTTRLDQIISFRTQQENRVDELIGKSTTGNTTTIRNAQNQIGQYDRDITSLQTQITQLTSQRDSLRAIQSTKQLEISTNADIGTFVYIASIFDVSLDTVVKWFTLIIVLVFDPLAVALIIGFNFLVKRDTKTKTEELIEELTDTIEEEQPQAVEAEPYTPPPPMERKGISS